VHDGRDGRDALTVQDKEEVIPRRGQVGISRSGYAKRVAPANAKGEGEEALTHVKTVGSRAEPDKGDGSDARGVRRAYGKVPPVG